MERSHLDIIAEIFTLAMKRRHKTRIMYGCNLSHNQLKLYLKLLLRVELLVTFVDEKYKTKFFKTTTKGAEFIDTYLKLKLLLS